MHVIKPLNFAHRFYGLLPAIALMLAPLAQSGFFVNTFYTSLFAFAIAACLAILGAGLGLLGKPAMAIDMGATKVWLLLVLWAAYIWLHGQFTGGGTLGSHFLLVSIATCFALSLYRPGADGKPAIPLWPILAVAIVQVAFCLLQFLKIIVLPGADFIATGTWGNPNIGAIYLALALPIAWHGALTNNRYRKGYRLLLGLMAICLLLLQCRTALIGAGLATAIMLQWRYGLLHRFWGSSKAFARMVWLLLGIAAIGAGGMWLYLLKQQSVEGRQFIWQLSANMIAQKPLTGYGYGRFEHAYNLQQANYFGSHSATEAQVQNAAHVNMAYNEFLHHTVEGGLVGLLFFGLFAFLLLRCAYRYLKQYGLLRHTTTPKAGGTDEGQGAKVVVATAGIVCMLLMSLVNFTLLAIPVMSVFIVYAATIIRYSLNKGPLVVHNNVKRFVGAALLAVGILLGIQTATFINGQLAIKNMVALGMAKQYAPATEAIEKIPQCGRNNGDYWLAVGNVHYFNNNKAAAAIAYQQASAYISTPTLYQQWGNCCAALGRYQDAINHYQIAQNIQPNRFTPRYLLLMLYVQMKDGPNVLKQATAIMDMKVKVPSPQIDRYKKTAQQILQQFKTNH
jgi:O-antigen polymerase